MRRIMWPLAAAGLLTLGLAAAAPFGRSAPPCWSNSPHKVCATTTGTTTQPTTTTATVPTTTTATTTTVPTTTTVTTTSASPLGSKLPARMPESDGPVLSVAPSGGGTTCTASAPCSLNTAWSKAASGNIIQLAGGTYSGYVVLQHRQFDPASPVTIEAAPGADAKLVGCPSSCTQNTFYLGDVTAVRVRGLDITGQTNGGAGIRLEDVSHVEVDRVTIHDTYSDGILVSGTTLAGVARTYSNDVQVWDSTLHDNCSRALGTTSNQCHAVYMGGGDHTDGVKHGVDGFVIANTLIYHHPGGYEFQIGDMAANGIVTNNTLDSEYQPASSGVGAATMWAWGSGSYQTNHVVFVNNLITNAAGPALDGVCGCTLAGIDVHGNMGWRNAGSPEWDGTYGSTQVFPIGPEYPDADPLYVGAGDYRLQSGSPARGIGDPDYVPALDHDGNARSGATVGAYR